VIIIIITTIIITRETKMVYKFTASSRELILNKFRIYNVWHIPWRKPCQLPD